jgi:hypothetical protein
VPAPSVPALKCAIVVSVSVSDEVVNESCPCDDALLPALSADSTR